MALKIDASRTVDAEMRYLEDLGYEGTINDMIHQYLLQSWRYGDCRRLPQTTRIWDYQ